MSDEVQLKEGSSEPAVTASQNVAADGSKVNHAEKKSWFKGALGMGVCCGAPLLLVGAITLFGVSLGAIASGALTVGAILACPVGMYIMMRMMNKSNK